MQKFWWAGTNKSMYLREILDFIFSQIPSKIIKKFAKIIKILKIYFIISNNKEMRVWLAKFSFYFRKVYNVKIKLC